MSRSACRSSARRSITAPRSISPPIPRRARRRSGEPLRGGGPRDRAGARAQASTPDGRCTHTRPRKRFGQNFLVDPHYVASIVAAVAPRPGDNLVEIGPGQAALTRPLIERAGKIHAIEIDRDLAARLAAQFSADELALHVADALDFDFATLGPRLRVVGNLPYNISTPLLFHLAAFEPQLADLHVMLQREVVARMTAHPATPDYGRLSVMLQAKFRATRLFVVPPGAFRPGAEDRLRRGQARPAGRRKAPH